MKSLYMTATLLAAAFSLSNHTVASTLNKTYELNTAYAEKLAKIAREECITKGAHVSISVVNDQGRLMYFYRGDNTGSNTVHTSFRKAYTAATVKMPTSALSKAVDAPGLSQLGKMEDDILLLTGGLPVFYDNQLVGGIGLSGSPNPALEEECGKFALEKIAKK